MTQQESPDPASLHQSYLLLRDQLQRSARAAVPLKNLPAFLPAAVSSEFPETERLHCALAGQAVPPPVSTQALRELAAIIPVRRSNKQLQGKPQDYVQSLLRQLELATTPALPTLRLLPAGTSFHAEGSLCECSLAELLPFRANLDLN